MAEFRLTKKQPNEKSPVEPRIDDPAITASVSQRLSDLAKTGMDIGLSGLHTLGSMSSYPSRLVHGAINSATGCEGGFGNTSLMDSSGGIEMSRHLERAGLIEKNDPTKWELRDPLAGMVDVAGDPTSWIGLGALTKKGADLAKLGRHATTEAVGHAGEAAAEGLKKGWLNQIKAGERGLIGFRAHPLAAEAVAPDGFLSGKGTAAALTSIGNAPGIKQIGDLASAARNTKLASQFIGAADGRVGGMIDPDLQRAMSDRHGEVDYLNNIAREDTTRWKRSLDEKYGYGMDEDKQRAFRDAIEGTAPSNISGGYIPHPHRETFGMRPAKPGKAAVGRNYVMVPVETRLLDGKWKSAPTLSHSERVQMLSDNAAGKSAFAPVLMPDADMKSFDILAEPGRVEFARELGEPVIQVMVPKSMANAFRRKYGTGMDAAAGPMPRRNSGFNPPEAAEINQFNKDILARNASSGAGPGSMDETLHNYSTRHLKEGIADPSLLDKGRQVAGKTPDDIRRDSLYGGSYEGTNVWNKLFQDEALPINKRADLYE